MTYNDRREPNGPLGNLSKLTKLVTGLRQDISSQTGRILPDLEVLQGIGSTIIAGGIIDDRKYLVR
jgi:hypothetical protein